MANPSKTIFAITPSSDPKKPYWNKIGVGFTNRDGSINIKLFGLPINGECQMRDFVSREEYDNAKQGNRVPKAQNNDPTDEPPDDSGIPF